MGDLIIDDASGLKKLQIKTTKGTTAEVFLHGAHLTSWKTSGGEEIIFVSKQAIYKPPKAIRGGIPVCFPQFGGFGPLSQHGFARNSEFTVKDSKPDVVTLSFTPSEDQLKLFPHPFELQVQVQVGDNLLEQTLTAINTGDAAFDLTAALHTYFAISSIDKTSVEGLQGVEYLDSLQNKQRLTQNDPSVRFTGEVDRIYLQTPNRLEIVDEGKQRAIVIKKEGFPDAVVWNPWREKAAGMADFGNDEYKGMVCVEPAVAGSGPVSLQPGQLWSAKQKLSLRQL